MKYIKTYERINPAKYRRVVFSETVDLPKFKIGEKVICIDDSANVVSQKLGLKNGDEYEIISVNIRESGNSYIVKDSNGKKLCFEDDSGFGEYRFMKKLDYDIKKYNI